MISNFKKIFTLFSRRERRQTFWIFLGIMGMGLTEITGIASITPFMAVVSNPDIIHSNKYLHQIYTIMNFTTLNQFMFFLGVLIIFVIAFSNGYSAFVIWILTRFTFLRGYAISRRLLIKYLNQPYVFFLNRNTAELSENILMEVNRVITGVLIPSMDVITRIVITVSILVMLIIVDPVLAISVAFVLGGSYSAVFWFVRKKLSTIGELCVEARSQYFKAASEALGGVKDIKLLGRESVFIRRFSVPSRSFAKYEASYITIALMPKYALETIAFGGILLIVLYLIGVKQNLEHALPLVALYSFAGYRLMPSLQRMFSGLAIIRYNLPALDLLYDDLTRQGDYASIELESDEQVEPLSFNDKIALRDIVYYYPNTQAPAVDKLNIEIRSNTTVGFVGMTGSGKTTTVDIILGLLSPSGGTFVVDGVEITKHNVRNWQRNLGYVPQSIYLTDDAVKHNIAFGVADDKIDNDAVEQAARIANLHDFVETELPDKYETVIGERGIRLSGGQRQRIGIARALYHNPKVLIFDEATSALDGITENAIMDAIKSLSGKRTILMIAHRLTTVKECDVIYMLEKGKVIAHGTYSELMKSNPKFRQMANVSLPDSV